MSDNNTTAGFSEAEKAAMRERAKEVVKGNDGESALLAKIAEMPESDRTMAQKIHAIVQKVAPELMPKTWYGMPAYANKDGKVICFFKSADKFKERYATFGFSDLARVDEGNMWPNAYALTSITDAEEAVIADLITKAIR